MSEEKNLSAEPKKSGCCKLLVAGVIISLILSIASLSVSLYGLLSGKQEGGEPQAQKVVISKQYDKGQSFEKAKATGKPVVAFFYADWCGYCQRFAPLYNKIAKQREIKNNVGIAYINCEAPENAELVKEYGISAFPTVYVVKPDGTKIQLENNTFFGDDSKEVVTKNILDAIK